jgi:hypothetical protein
MKSTVSEKPCESEVKYPCLMKYHKGYGIILFDKESCGTVVDDGHSSGGRFNHVGYYSETWKMNDYEPFHGSVCLEN